MIRSCRASYPCAWLLLSAIASACTPLEPTEVSANDDGGAATPDARAEPGSPRDDAGNQAQTDGGTPARPPSGGAGSSGSAGSGGSSGSGSGDAGSPQGRCLGDGEMVDLPTGDVLRGNKEFAASSPAMIVHVEGFALDVTEVTVIAYADCVDAGECTEPRRVGFCNWGVRGRDCHPMNCVNWEQANAYCAWAEKRLPNEDEWEFAAAGAAEPRLWPWGSEDGAEMHAHYNGNAGTLEVGSLPLGATPEGLLDMAGNVREWTSSTWCESYEDDAVCDPTLHVVRGGSWEAGDFTQLYPYYREPGPEADFEPGPDGIDVRDRYGFRCAR